ncbi:MAG: imidazole glycerol phosphate synthase subunit HisH [Euryarchaeota archaeon]|nr:imidazole glycerol phosphate synthase subunit HisH [Euryarchaeota archaeon]
MIGIIDYGAGNIQSVKRTLGYLGEEPQMVTSPKDFKDVHKLILPGVGAFRSAAERLRVSGMYNRVEDWIRSEKPFLGICLGMQLLFEESEEAEGTDGFGVFKGRVVRFKGRKVPQMGWNQVKIQKNSPLMSGIKDNSFFYFLHGYHLQTEEDIVVGTTEYGVNYPSVIGEGNSYAVQFHPEKSGNTGLKLLKNWVRKC